MGIQIHTHALAEITKLVVKSITGERQFWRIDPAVNTECIKRLREVTGLTLSQAKNLVDAASDDPVFDVARKICRE